MATYYSQGTGNWSTVANWNDARDGSGASPASVAAMDDQLFVIQPSHVITFDVEDDPAVDGSVSGWVTGIASLTIEGHSTTPGNLALSSTTNTSGMVYGFHLKTNGIVQGTSATVFGKITGGSESTPIPSGARTTFRLYGTANTAAIKGTYLTVELYGSGPTEPVYSLTTTAGVGATTLQVEGLRDGTNPNTETEWVAGASVLITSWVKGRSVQYRTLAATPTGDGVLYITSGLSAGVIAEGLVTLVYRNITFLSKGCGTNGRLIDGNNRMIFDSVCFMHPSSTRTGVAIGYYANYSTFSGTTVFASFDIAISLCSYINVKDRVTIVDCNRGLYTISVGNITDEVTITGVSTVFSTGSAGIGYKYITIGGDTIIHGCGSVIYTPGCGTVVKDNVIIKGCDYGTNAAYGVTMYGTKIYYCDYALYGSYDVKLYGCELGNVTSRTNTADIHSTGTKAYNTILASATEVSTYQSVATEDPSFCSVVAWEKDGVTSAYPVAWMPGGTVVRNTTYSPMPSGHFELCEMTFAQPSGQPSGTYWRNWVDIPLYARSGEVLRIALWMKKDTTSMGITPRAALLTCEGDPWEITPLDDYTMTDDTNAQEATLEYAVPTDSTFRQVFLRVWGGHTSGKLYWAYKLHGPGHPSVGLLGGGLQ